MLSIPYYCYRCQQIVLAFLFDFLSNQISYGNQLIYLTAQKFRDENLTSGYLSGISINVCMWQSKYVQHACLQRIEMAEAGKSMSPEGATPDRADR